MTEYRYPDKDIYTVVNIMAEIKANSLFIHLSPTHLNLQCFDFGHSVFTMFKSYGKLYQVSSEAIISYISFHHLYQICSPL